MAYFIGFAGKAGSGKDAAASAVMETLKHYSADVLHLPFAKVLKEMAMEIWDYTYEEVYVTKPPHVRKNLQRLGTEIMRSRDPGFWIRRVFEQGEAFGKDQLRGKGTPFVFVTDVRFKNEATFIKETGILIRIKRDTPTPENALNEEAQKHASETEMDSMPDEDFDLVIENNYPSVEAMQSDVTIKVIGLLLRKVKEKYGQPLNERAIQRG